MTRGTKKSDADLVDEVLESELIGAVRDAKLVDEAIVDLDALLKNDPHKVEAIRRMFKARALVLRLDDARLVGKKGELTARLRALTAPKPAKGAPRKWGSRTLRTLYLTGTLHQELGLSNEASVDAFARAWVDLMRPDGNSFTRKEAARALAKSMRSLSSASTPAGRRRRASTRKAP